MENKEFPEHVKEAIHSYEDISRPYYREKEYALTTWKTCPKCKTQKMCALGPSEIYTCPNCGYKGEWLAYPSGFAEYRKGASWPEEPLWPENK